MDFEHYQLKKFWYVVLQNKCGELFALSMSENTLKIHVWNMSGNCLKTCFYPKLFFLFLVFLFLAVRSGWIKTFQKTVAFFPKLFKNPPNKIIGLWQQAFIRSCLLLTFRSKCKHLKGRFEGTFPYTSTLLSHSHTPGLHQVSQPDFLCL